MFAMLRGAWPRVLADGTSLAELETGAEAGTADELDAAVGRLVEEVVRAQEGAGLDVVTDGSVRWPDPGAVVLRALAGGDTGPRGPLVAAWSATAALTGRIVAQAVPGPYSLGRRVDAGRGAGDRTEFTLELAEGLAGELRALAEAGCAMVVVDEPDAASIGADPAERDLFLAVQRRLLAQAGGLHAMLAVTGGSAWEAGAEAIVGAPYASFLFDLIAGPDNWYLVRAAPGDRGIVCAALRADLRADQAPELVWAARYAASSNGRGLERVGLANATSLASLPPAEARRALGALGRSAHLAGLPPEQAVAEGLDPRTVRQPADRAPRGRGKRLG